MFWLKGKREVEKQREKRGEASTTRQSEEARHDEARECQKEIRLANVKRFRGICRIFVVHPFLLFHCWFSKCSSVNEQKKISCKINLGFFEFGDELEDEIHFYDVLCLILFFL